MAFMVGSPGGSALMGGSISPMDMVRPRAGSSGSREGRRSSGAVTIRAAAPSPSYESPGASLLSSSLGTPQGSFDAGSARRGREGLPPRGSHGGPTSLQTEDGELLVYRPHSASSDSMRRMAVGQPERVAVGFDASPAPSQDAGSGATATAQAKPASSTSVSLLGRQLAALDASPSDPLKAPQVPNTNVAPRSPDAILAAAQAEHAVFGDKLVRRAFGVAASAHAGQFRKNGESVMEHLAETAKILASAGLQADVVAAGLLHDVLDDTMMTETGLRELVPKAVVDMVVGVSKMSAVSQLHRDAGHALGTTGVRSLRNMFLAMTDARVVTIKLADRLHNMRTIGALPRHKRESMAAETLDVFAPLANRMGIWSLKSELEDLCFSQLNPEEYAALSERTADEVERATIATRLGEVRDRLASDCVRAVDISGRPKNLYGIYKKMRDKGVRYEEVYDVRAIRVIVEDEAECYKVLEAMHEMYAPVEGKAKDYIAAPKANGYQSLHTVVRDEHGAPFEVQVRTAAMHELAEFGVAAHWRYKESLMGSSKYVEMQVAWARFMLSFQCGVRDTKLHAETAHEPVRRFEHAKDCPAHGFSGVGAMPKCECSPILAPSFASDMCGACEDDEEAPVLVVAVSGGAMEVKELPASHSRLRDLLAAPELAAGVASGELCVVLNDEPVQLEWDGLEGEEAAVQLSVGDRVELIWAPRSDVDLSPAAVSVARSRLQAMIMHDDAEARPSSWEDRDGKAIETMGTVPDYVPLPEKSERRVSLH